MCQQSHMSSSKKNSEYEYNTSRDLYYSARLHTYLQVHCHSVTHNIKC